MAEDREVERLREVVAAYGADPARWPAGERGRLEPVAREWRDAPWMAEARDVDTLLGAVPGARMSAGLAERIAAAAATTPRALPDRVAELPVRRRGWQLPEGLVRSGQGALLAASLLAGFWLGATGRIDELINGPPTGLAAMAPGMDEEFTLSSLWWDVFNSDGPLP